MRLYRRSEAVRHSITATLVFVLAGAWASAQAAVISGEVYDPELGQGVEYANVVLFLAEDSTQVTGAATGPGGRFELTVAEPGEYYLEVSFIGYRTSSVYDVEVAAEERLDLGRLDITQKPVAVEGAEAVAEKPTFKYEVDKKVIEVGKMPTVQSGTAVDALENAPSVQVDIEGNVSLRGSRNFTVQVDGKPTVLEPSDALRQIPASIIERIEIITNPSAKYDPDGVAGIVNVVLKKQRAPGFSALADLNAGFRNRYGGDLLLGYRQGAVNAHLGADFNQRPWYSQMSYDNLTFRESETLRVVGTGDNTWRSRFGGARGGAELTFGPHDVSSFNARYGLYRSDNSSLIDVEESYLAGDSGRNYANEGGRGWDGRYLYVYADHQHSFDTVEHKVLLSASFARSQAGNWNQTQVLGADKDTTSGRRSDEQGPQQRTRLEAEYTLPLRDKDKLETGYHGRLESTDQQYDQSLYDTLTGRYEPDTENCHPYWGARYIHAGYATYQWNWRKLGVKLGMRGEYGERVIEVDDLNQQYEVRRWDFFPSAHASYVTPVGQMTASYSRRIQRPWPWMLRPFDSWASERFVMRGNPDITPEYTGSYELGYQAALGTNTFSLEGFYRSTTDAFEWVQRVHPDIPNVLLQTPVNAGTQRSLGAELMTNLVLFRVWTLNLTGSLYDYRVEGELEGEDFSRHSLDWRARVGNDLRLLASTRLSFNVYYSSPSVSAQGTNQGYFVTDAAIQQVLLNRALAVTLRVRDPFATGRWEGETQGPGFSMWNEFIGDSRVVSLSVRYNFNNFRLSPKMREGDEMQIQGGQGGPQG
ncbi:MAG: TonB-dependent receptor [candidate division WOR-3 bacterium]|nr:MAG: TonB-dependent receptor [candidate division WOR-3 bacterium]